jgi:hypothetical protein
LVFCTWLQIYPCWARILAQDELNQERGKPKRSVCTCVCCSVWNSACGVCASVLLTCAGVWCSHVRVCGVSSTLQHLSVVLETKVLVRVAKNFHLGKSGFLKSCLLLQNPSPPKTAGDGEHFACHGLTDLPLGSQEGTLSPERLDCSPAPRMVPTPPACALCPGAQPLLAWTSSSKWQMNEFDYQMILFSAR